MQYGELRQSLQSLHFINTPSGTDVTISSSAASPVCDVQARILDAKTMRIVNINIILLDILILSSYLDLSIK